MSVPRILLPGLLALGSGLVCLAQTPVSFTGITSTAGETPEHIYAVDLNNDGITDILQDTGQSKPGFTVSLGNGNGTFKPPVLYADASPSLIGLQPLVTGDFNNDGKVDVAVILTRSNQIEVFLGNGDGSFQSPKTSTLSLPSGWGFNSGGAAAGDFNGDGKIDIAAWTCNCQSTAQSEPTALYVMQGDGAGSFSSPHLALSGPNYEPDFRVFVGDYDADGKADIATDTYTLDSEGNDANFALHVLYGNKDFTFADTVPLSIPSGELRFGSGDLNSDGITDLYGFEYSSGGAQLAFLYGATSRTFKSYYMNPSASYHSSAISDYNPELVLGDFNGDGRMDLAAIASNLSYNTDYVDFFLVGSSAGQFTEQVIQVPQTYIFETTPIVGLFGTSRLKPDVAFSQSPNYGSPPQNQPSYLVAEDNNATSGWFGPCTYPHSARGFHVCAAGTLSGTNATFNAAAASFGQLRKIELWIDGKKVSEQHHTWDHHGYFSYTAAFAAGSHNATFYAADVDNRLQRYDFTFSGAGVCTAPSGYGINLCSPVNNSTVNSPVPVQAVAHISGTLARMEIWVDGVKKFTQFNGATLSTSIPVAAGKHRFDIYAVNTVNTKWEATSYVTVP